MMKDRRMTALRTALVYMLAGALWIIATDSLLSLLADDIKITSWISIVKGLVFVVVSAVIVYILVHNLLKRMMALEMELLQTSSETEGSKKEAASSYEQLLAMRKKLYDMAYFDQLTGLRNQMSLQEDIRKLIGSKGRFAMIYMDIDNFKYVNDTLGHQFGNLVLKGICNKLAGLMDENCDMYRLAGDKFIVICRDIGGILDIEQFALRILKSFKDAVVVESKPFYHTVSIGVSMYPEHGETMVDLIKCAEIALFKAKESGKNRIVIYRESMVSSIHEWVDTERYLRNALEKNEFELYFQPQYGVEKGEITGFEALIRWRNDEMGFVMPSRFLKVAEDTNMITAIGEWVLRNACIFLKRLQQEGFGDRIVSVNVSKMQILQNDFVDSVMEIAEIADIDPRNLEIEVSEAILIEYYDMVAEKLNTLKKHGIRIAIDNFGRGYSALNYLRKLPITTVKIDKTFSDIITLGEDSRILTDFMIKIARSAKLQIVGDGVESREQFDYLCQNGCHRLQGYYLSRPLPEWDALRQLQEAAADAERE
ncbi:MAG: bifunctional diguanylate cyclase/phosphodiesterase [Clostridiaceae bacterium]|jgi:diguanylate cyclase (GGDEF)-like protein|nr:bifunctional diguanylate cyclase/phosphodiesterase [Clostridiaceae bacterium]